jgi:PAS domain S-box-containing protein
MAGMVKSKYLALLTAYAYLYAVGTLVVFMLDTFGFVDHTITMAGAWLACVVILYNAVLFRFTAPQFGRRAAYVVGVSLLAALIIVCSVTTGGYGSFSSIGLALLLFLSSMLGSSVPFVIIWVTVLGYILVLTGLIPTLNDAAVGGAVTVGYIVSAVIGWVVFRRFYVQQDPVVEQLQRALAVEKLQSSAVLSSINDGIMIVNRDGVIRHANQKALDMIALTAEEFIGKHYADIASKKVRITYSTAKKPRLKHNVTKVLRTGVPVEIEAQTMEYTDGRPTRDVSISLTPLKNDDGELNAVLIITRDITGLMNVQRLKDDFISTASHELRTPITVIAGYTDLLLNQNLGSLTEKQQHYIERTKESTKLLTQLVNDMLDISQLESGRRANAPEKIQLKQVLDDVVTSNKTHFSTRHIVLGLQSDDVEVFVDKTRLEQVMECLLSNAYKFTPENGSVNVQTQAGDDGVTVTVIDSGEGVPADKTETVFDKFTKLDDTGTIPGTGLGLAIAKRIVTDWGGEIHVKNESTGGANFYFTIPNQNKADL